MSLPRGPRRRLRIAALIALAAGLLFLPIEILTRPGSDLPALLIGWAVHTALASFALVASYLALKPSQVDRLVVALVLAHAVNAHVYLRVPPHNPALVASGLICLLMVGPVFFSWTARRTAIIAALTCGAFLAVGSTLPPELIHGGSFPVAFGSLLVGASLAVASARVLGQLRVSLVRRRHELMALSTRLMSAQEEERQRLSRELHDEFGQSLTAVNAYLWLIEQHPTEIDTIRARSAEARRAVSRTLTAMRELSQLLRPSVLDEFGLVPSLDGELKAFARRHGIATSFTTDGLPERLPPELETALYRIAQEALTNVARHARATRVQVALVVAGGELRLEVEDDGGGFPARNGDGGRIGTGLVGIRERVRALGGTLAIHSGKGVRLRVALPFA